MVMQTTSLSSDRSKHLQKHITELESLDYCTSQKSTAAHDHAIPHQRHSLSGSTCKSQLDVWISLEEAVWHFFAPAAGLVYKMVRWHKHWSFEEDNWKAQTHWKHMSYMLFSNACPLHLLFKLISRTRMDAFGSLTDSLWLLPTSGQKDTMWLFDYFLAAGG